MTQAIATIGALIGYALVMDSTVFITAIPVALGILFVISISNQHEMLTAALQLMEIESTLSDDNSAFRYQIDRGGQFGGVGKNRGAVPIEWYLVPYYIIIVLFSSVYLSSIVVAVSLWPADHAAILSWQVSRWTLLVGYALFTLVLLIAAISHLKFRQQLFEEARELGVTDT